MVQKACAWQYCRKLLTEQNNCWQNETVVDRTEQLLTEQNNCWQNKTTGVQRARMPCWSTLCDRRLSDFLLLLLLIKLRFLISSGFLVLLVLGHQVVHVGLRFRELHLIHSLTCVPVKEGLQHNTSSVKTHLKGLQHNTSKNPSERSATHHQWNPISKVCNNTCHQWKPISEICNTPHHQRKPISLICNTKRHPWKLISKVCNKTRHQWKPISRSATQHTTSEKPYHRSATQNIITENPSQRPATQNTSPLKPTAVLYHFSNYCKHIYNALVSTCMMKQHCVDTAHMLT